MFSSLIIIKMLFCNGKAVSEHCHRLGSGNSSMIAIISLISMVGRCTRTPAVICSHTHTRILRHPTGRNASNSEYVTFEPALITSLEAEEFFSPRSCRRCMTTVLPRRRLTHCVIMSGVAGVCVYVCVGQESTCEDRLS